MSRAIFVTGAAGVIGRRLVPQQRDAGYEVAATNTATKPENLK